MLMRALVILAFVSLQTLAATAQTQRDFWEMQNWKTDLNSVVIDPGQIIDVIGKDAIPAIDDPLFGAVADEDRIPDNEPVVAFTHDGVSRAYPIRYLMWHEIVNDTVAGLPVAVTYCPLCNTAIVFERVLDGNPVTFGTTGKLRHSDLIMYDRGEENWWQQFSGRAIVGKRAGQKLKMLPSAMISFSMFKQRFPDGEVLLPDPARASQAGVNPYAGYDTAIRPFLFRGELPTDIEPMMRVALVPADQPVAVALPHLQEHAPLRHKGYEFRWVAGQASALDDPTIAQGRDVGTIEVFKIDPDGRAEEPVVHTVTFAFAARAFDRDLEILQ